jgi:hypothetical protein
MSVAGGSPHSRPMDPLSFLPAITWLVVFPVALGLAVRWLAGDEADDAIPPLSALLTTETRPRPVRGAQDAEFVPWRFDTPRARRAPTDPPRRRPAAKRPSPADAKV